MTATIVFRGGPHDGDRRVVINIRDEYYRTSNSKDVTLFNMQNDARSLIRYVRIGDSLTFQSH